MKMQSQKLLHCLILGLLMLVASCTPVALNPETKQSQTPGSTALTGNAPPAGDTPSVAQRETAEPTQESSSSQGNCLPETTVTLEPAAYELMPAAILEFLNSGGTFSQLDQDLYLQGFAAQPIGVIRGDINGDSSWDVVVDVINPYSPSIPPQANLLLYLCQAGQYQLQMLPPPPNQSENSPIIRSFQDLNADGRAELVVSYAGCGAHTCFEQPVIFGWEDDAVVNLLEGFGEPAPNPKIEVNGPDANGYFVLLVQAGGIGSVGAGPQRSSQSVYAFQPEKNRWEFFARQLETPKYRLHVLQEADQLARQEKYADALILYEQVISSTILQDWINPEYEQAVLGAYARYRMILINEIVGNNTLASAMLDDLQAQAQADDRLAGYLEMAQLFRREGGAEDPAQACAAVRKYAASRADQVLVPLGSQQFGYSNQDYTPEDLCPWE